MALLLAGSFLIALGVFSGAVLVLVPLGLVAWKAGPVLWVLFPLFCVSGYILFVMGGRVTQIRPLSVAVSVVLLLLAMAAAAALVMQAAGVVPAAGDTLSLWYVLGVAGVLGIMGAASFGKRPDDA